MADIDDNISDAHIRIGALDLGHTAAIPLPWAPPTHSTETAGTIGGFGGGPVYWNKRYNRDPKPFEWLRGFQELKPLITEITGGSYDKEILHVGCGNSLLPEKMYDAGYHNIINIDNSSVVIEHMSQRNAQRHGMEWREMDATKMDNFCNSCFDVVIDKSTLDAMACGDKSTLVIATYANEVQRVLRPGGVFICITFGKPECRLEYFNTGNLEFSVRTEVLTAEGATSNHWAYVCRKPDVIGDAPSPSSQVEKELTP